MSLSLVAVTPSNTIPLLNGTAERMGDGHFILLQIDDLGAPQAITVTEADLRAMLAA